MLLRGNSPARPKPAESEHEEGGHLVFDLATKLRKISGLDEVPRSPPGKEMQLFSRQWPKTCEFTGELARSVDFVVGIRLLLIRVKARSPELAPSQGEHLEQDEIRDRRPAGAVAV
jgi:hypothetical protein